MSSFKTIAILGGGNIGLSIAKSLQKSNLYDAKNICITRRNKELLEDYKNAGFFVTSDNIEAVSKSEVIIIAVQPQQLNELLAEISGTLQSQKHTALALPLV